MENKSIDVTKEAIPVVKCEAITKEYKSVNKRGKKKIIKAGDIIEVYSSQAQAALENDLTGSDINASTHVVKKKVLRVLKSKQTGKTQEVPVEMISHRTLAGGYVYRRLTDEEKAEYGFH